MGELRDGKRFKKNKINKKFRMILFVLFAFAFIYAIKGIIAYFTAQQELLNPFELGTRIVTYEYNVIDENGNSTQLQQPITREVFDGDTLTLVGDHALVDDPNYHLKFEIDGVPYNNQQYTVNGSDVTVTQDYYRKIYTVEFNANGGTGTMNDQKFLYNVSQNLTQNAFSKSNAQFLGWNTEANGTGTSYTDEELVNNLTNVHEGVVTLYAQWLSENPSITYYYGDNLTFDGTQYIDSDLKLFSSTYLHNNIEVRAEIDEFTYLSGQNNGINTVMSEMGSTSPYYGFSFRYREVDSQAVYNFVRNCHPTASGGIDYYPVSTTNSFRIVREDDKLYADINNTGTLSLCGDYSTLPSPHNIQVVFGATLDSSNKPFRYLNGKLSGVAIKTELNSSQIPVTLPTPTRTGYTFLGWYSDSTFTNKVGNGGAQYTPSGDVTLYARWRPIGTGERYEYNGEYVFDGTNYIDTQVCLYSNDNIDRPFLVSFDIDSVGNNSDGSTICGSVDESDSTLPGHIVRFDNGSIQLESNSNTSTAGDIVIPNGVKNVRIARVNNLLYYSFDGQPFTQINNYTGYTDCFDTPVTFGASLDENSDPHNYFEGTLSDLLVEFLDDNITINDLNQRKVLSTVYKHEGAKTFNGTSDYIDTGLSMFKSDTAKSKDFEISFTIDEIASGYVNQATIVNCKDESVNTYPGFVYRLYTAGTAKFEARAGSGSGASNSQSTVHNVKIARKSGKMYLTINNGVEKEVYDFNGYSGYFDVPITIGASINAQGQPFRFFKGTLSNIVVKVQE